MSKPISVILPCYNVASFLDRSIGSVLCQTRAVHQIIAADDCSRDDTVAKLKTFGPKVDVLTAARNEGPAARRNDALRMSTGDYIALLDPDDWWDENHVEAVAGLLDRCPDAGVAFSKVRLAGDSSGIWPGCTLSSDRPMDMLQPLMRNTVIQASSVIFRREVIDRIGFFEDWMETVGGRKVYGWGGDYEWLLRAAAFFPFIGTDLPTVHYHIRPGEAEATADKLIQFHHYRLMALSKLREHIPDKDAWGGLLDRHQMAWEEDLEKIWIRRELIGLRRLCRLGMLVPHLRRHTIHYLPRAWFGGFQRS